MSTLKENFEAQHGISMQEDDDKEPEWLEKFYTPSKDMPAQYRSPKFEENLRGVQFNYAGAILSVYEDIGMMADKVRGFIDSICNVNATDIEKIDALKLLQEKLFKRRDCDGEGWHADCPSVWYATPLATLADPNMIYIDLGVGRLGNEKNVRIDWDIII